MANKEMGFNGVLWTELEGVSYLSDYRRAWEEVASKKHDELSVCRELIRSDIWFIVYFVLKNTLANHPFVVERCRDMRDGPRTKTVDLWARGHLKTTIITVAETIQDIVLNPEERIAIFSYRKYAAMKILRMIKYTLESSELLKSCFPDELWWAPSKEAPNWGEETGLVCRRRGIYREPTVSAWGLLDGMPTGDHFTKRVYDDVVVEEIADSPDLNERLKEQYDLSFNLSTFQETDRVRVVGTPYNYHDALMYIQDKKDVISGESLYVVRKKPATVDGTYNGASVFVPETALAEARTNKRKFASQQLLDPSPQDELKLHPESLKEVEPHEVPKGLWKFMVVDPAGLRLSDSREGDSWGIICYGILPYRSDIGSSELYILDAVIEPLEHEAALKAVADMYMRNGRVLKLGVEKAGISTMEIHIANYLFAQGRIVNTKNGRLHVLKPGGRSKHGRIQANLEWPLNNGKIHISRAVPIAVRERLRLEMRKFPYWKDDGIDALAYAYDLVKDYRFGKAPTSEVSEVDRWDRDWEDNKPRGWMIV